MAVHTPFIRGANLEKPFEGTSWMHDGDEERRAKKKNFRHSPHHRAKLFPFAFLLEYEVNKCN